MAAERIQKILSDYGICSRRAAEQMLKDGKILVNGMVAELGQRADPEADEISVDGKLLPAKPEKVYIVLNKPKGYVTSLSDEKGRKNVSQLVAEVGTRVYPVGRLDINSEGLLLMTNDGDFSNYLMHPSHEIEKEYHTWVKGRNISKAVKELSKMTSVDGIEISKPKVKIMEEEQEKALLSITIHEGKNRQVRKMCEQVGLLVVRLKRVREGRIRLGHLKTGDWRYLSNSEVQKIMQEK